MQLNLNNISYTYPLAVEPVLAGVSATFPQGWTGIVGDNGAGKTTLALVACGLLAPDAGSVTPALVAAYCTQDATEPPEALEEFALAYDSEAIELRRDLDIADDWPWRYATLSGGQQKRLQIACALWRTPDMLVLDEPTNHVDATTRKVIEHALAGFRGVGLLISHDRALLDALCSQCLFVSADGVTMRPGGYSQASGQAAIERQSAVRAHEEARREQRRIAREAQRRREEAAQKESGRSLRGIAKHDNDARHKKRAAIVWGTDGIAAHQSARMEARLAKADAQAASTAVARRYDANIWLDARPSRRPVLLRMEEGVLEHDTWSLAYPPLYVGNTDHIALVGDNGSGKTTLVKSLVDQLSEGTRYLYVPQEPTEAQRTEVLMRLIGLSAIDRGRALSVVAQLNSDPDRVLEGDVVSPGELRKLMLALGILDSPELIIMDEPTNHLDLGSTEALERLLAGYPGALLLVSHDAALLGATTTITWSIEQRGSQAWQLTVR